MHAGCCSSCWLLLAAAAAVAACMRACVATFVIDTILNLVYQLTRRRRPARGESIFCIEIFEKNQPGQKGTLKNNLL
jgi:hypothetical protein